MAVATTSAAEETAPIPQRQRLFTAEEFERLVETGIFGETERVELIEGRIVELNPIGPEHVWSVNDLVDIFRPLGDVVLSIQNPLRLAPRIQPQPDVVVLRRGAPRRRVPLAEHALLVIEVADTSLDHDRPIKMPLYAMAGIPEYWIADLKGERVEVYREPSPAGYRASRFYLRGEHLSPAFAPDLIVAVDPILGPTDAADSNDQTSAPA
jgi:Uma2 family endonuclease